MRQGEPQSKNSIVGITGAMKFTAEKVLLALNNHPPVKQKTVDRVPGMIKHVGYRRNALAAGLRSAVANVIRLIVSRMFRLVHAQLL
ncbi:MAG: hypothetical protein WKF89_13045 [Chitinophagaceae bacterium]